MCNVMIYTLSLLLTVVIGVENGYDIRCPTHAEWKLKAKVSCFSEDRYVCLRNLLERKYQEDCTGSDISRIGSKLVFQPWFDLAECNAEIFQPIVFTTYGNSECILRKSKCNEVGQVVYSNGSSTIDTACRCDYTQGYVFVTKPKNSCFCIPSEEDCSCFKVKCTKLSPDYQCVREGEMPAKTHCQEIYQTMSYNKNNQTVQFIDSNINRYCPTHQSSYIISVISIVIIVIIVIAVLKMPVFAPMKIPAKKPIVTEPVGTNTVLKESTSSTANKEGKRFIKEKCVKHYFARVIFIGETGVGKTSLMRRLLWKTKDDVLSTLSTDGIEIEKCNINVTNGKWSQCGNNVEISEINSNQQAETIRFEHSNDNTIQNKGIENEFGLQNNDKLDIMKSTIMKSYPQRNEDDPHEKLGFCWLWDFSYQKDFYITHQLFLSACAVYLIVTDNLEFKTDEKLQTDSINSAHYVRLGFDHVEAIHSYLSPTHKDCLDPSIIVVCTKGDNYPNLKIRQKWQANFQAKLDKVLSSQGKNKLLRNTYFVSNTGDEDTVFEDIRKDISEQAMNMHDWGRDLPSKWLLFQQKVFMLKDKGEQICFTSNLLEIANEIGIRDFQEFTKCLQYYHDIGTVIFFDEENLKQFVILDPKWLVRAFRCLVSEKNDIELSDDWLKLKKEGLLKDSLISLQFNREPKLRYSENKAHLIELMKRFDIIVKMQNSSELYMPCLMDACSVAEVEKQLMNRSQFFERTSWLCLEFEFLPPTFFNHILAWFIKHYYVSTILDKGKKYIRKALYRNIGVFNMNSNSSGCEQLMVCEGPNVIAFQVWDWTKVNTPYGHLVYDVCKFVDLLSTRYRLHISFKKLFKCSTGDFTISRTNLKDLLSHDYWCSDHGMFHSSDDLVLPWNLSEALEKMRQNDLERRKEQERESLFPRSVSCPESDGED